MKVVYVSSQFKPSGIYASQVEPVCREQVSNLEFQLVVFDRSVRKPSFEQQGKLRVERLRGLPFQYLPFFNFLQALILSGSTFLRSADILHCRGHFTASAALFCRKLLSLNYKIVADIRGAVVQEQQMKGGLQSRLYALRARTLERFVFRNADYFLFVSEPMRHFYEQLYGPRPHRIIPTIVDTSFFHPDLQKRNTIRKQLNLGNKKVLAYVGGVSAWQNVKPMIATFASMVVEHPDVFFLFITREEVYVRDLFRQHGVPEDRYHVQSLAYDEIPGYLCAADYGLLIRDDHVVNRVASPTKLNEYRACNLPVIQSLEAMKGMQAETMAGPVVNAAKSAGVHREIYRALFEG